MKPITDDVVYSLIQEIEARERPHSKRRAVLGTSAKIISFKSLSAKEDVSNLKARLPRRTIAGVFCYVSKLGTA